MVNPRYKTAGRKDCVSWVPVVRPTPPLPLEVQVPTCPGTQYGSSDTLTLEVPTCPETQHGSSDTLTLEVPTCPETQHGSSDTLLEILLGMQQQQMTLLQQQLAAQQQQIELQQQQQLARPLNYFLALKEVHAPNFAGSRDPLEAEKWITEMEKFCRALCIPKDEWVNVTIPFLIADAEAWFISVRHAYESGAVRISWAQFQDSFILNFFPATFRIEKENEFFNLKQGSMTVIQYASMFNQLGRFAPAIMVHEQSTVTRFEEGLNLNLREYMGTPQATTYQEVLEQALRSERLINSETVAAQGHGMSSMEKLSLLQIRSLQPTSANEKAIQEDFDGSTAHGQEDKKQIEALQKRIIQLEKDLEQKHALQLDVERLCVQLNDLKKVEELQKLSIEKEAKLKDQAKKQIEALHHRIIQLKKDLDKKHALQLNVERLRVQLNDLKTAEELQKLLIEKEAKLKDQANKHIEALQKRIIQLEKDLDKKHALQLNVEQLRRQLNYLKKVEELQKLSIEKEAKLKDQANKQIEALHQRIIQLEKDLDQKHALQLIVERLRVQLNDLKTEEELQKLLIEKEAKLKDQTDKQIEALQKRNIQLEMDLDKKHALQLNVERLREQLNDLKKAQKLLTEEEVKLKDQANKQIEALHQRTIQLEKDVDQKQVLQLNVERLCGQLNDLKKADRLQKLSIEKEAELKDQANKQTEALHQRIIQLEKDLDQKHALQLDVERLRGQLKKAEALQKLLIEKEAELKEQALQKLLIEKEAELKEQTNVNHALIEKELNSNDELQDALKEAINEQLDSNLFTEAMKRKYKVDIELVEKAIELCFMWAVYVSDSIWYPRTLIRGSEIVEEVFDENDPWLNKIKAKHGDAVHNIVITALCEINGYNPNGRQLITDIWDSVERIATLKKGVCILLGGLFCLKGIYGVTNEEENTNEEE